MFRVRLHLNVASEMISSAIKDYGCNMRSLVDVLSSHPELVDARITSKVDALNLTDLQKMLNADLDSGGTHTLIMSLCPQQPSADDTQYLKSDTVFRTFAGTVVFKALVHRHGPEFFKHVRLTAAPFGRIPQAASTGGSSWEAWCHQEIPKLSHLNLFKMVPKDTKLVRCEDTPKKRISIGPLIHQVYTSKDAINFTIDPTKYYIPSTSNNQTFDAFCRSKKTGIGLHMTIGTVHSLGVPGLQDLNRRLSGVTRRYFVFVIPKGQKVECPAPPPEWQSKFTFFILELDDGKCYRSPLDL
jgi:hypothetical protein